MKLCSDEFYKFYMSVPDATGSIEEISGYIAKAIPPICDMLGIGKIEICINNPQSPYEERIKDNFTMLYCFEEGYDDRPFGDTYATHSDGSAKMMFYPRKEVDWSSSDLQCLKFLSNILNTLCGKAGLAKLARISTVLDPVTSIPNTVGVNAFITDCCRKRIEHLYTAVCINIKNFRYLNQRLGSQSGDVILQKYAQRLQDYMRRDEMCGRVSNDNFLVLIKNERLDAFLNFIGNIRLHLNIDDVITTFSLQAKAGVYPIEKCDGISTVMYNSSMALDAARSSGQNDYVRFRPEMLTQLQRDKEIAGSFSKAIALNEFDVYYQPKFDLNTGKLCGCEALVRWSREGRLLPPSEFIPVLERDGTICALDLYVLEEVCISLREWLDRGISPVRISTNFSKVHLHNRYLAEDIMRILNKYSIPPEYIEIELTESSGYDDFASLSDFVTRIKNYGVYTSIDNFGTGYSSLMLINELEIDVIKLDRSFIRGIATDEQSNDAQKRSKNNEVVIRTIIGMAHALGIQVICEGVENNGQEVLLKQFSCDMVQGFLYDRPLPHDEFEERLQDSI